MKIAQIVPSLEASQGGPSVSVPNLAASLAGLGHDVQLFSTGELPAASPTAERLQVECYAREWPAMLGCSTGLRNALASSEAEIVHSHGLWLRPLHYAHTTARRLHRPLVISPRGMMSDWAWQHHSWRKTLARLSLHPGAFRGASGWHATSQEEVADIRRHGFKQPICLAPNGTYVPTPADRERASAYWREACPDVQRRPTAIFHSRFHRKKRVLELIDLWLATAPKDWLLLLVGIPEDYSVAQLETYVLRSSGGGRILIFDGTHRPPPYAVGALFLLPSFSENFGLVVAEAMAHGLPVLVTDTTPWSALNSLGAGWCVPFERFPATLHQALAEGPKALAERGAIARQHVIAEYSWEKSARLLADFYGTLIARSSAA